LPSPSRKNNYLRRHNNFKNNNKTKELTNAFVEEILKFNKAHNIVGRFTEKEIESLDIFDCEVILEHIPPEKKITRHRKRRWAPRPSNSNKSTAITSNHV
jgi:16S rRNA G527 N7-methylase RsmG